MPLAVLNLGTVNSSQGEGTKKKKGSLSMIKSSECRIHYLDLGPQISQQAINTYYKLIILQNYEVKHPIPHKVAWPL
jgi:hypothetical protein